MIKYRNIKHPYFHGDIMQIEHHGHGDWRCTDSFCSAMRVLKASSVDTLKVEIVKDFCLRLLGLRAYALVSFVEGHRMFRFMIDDESEELICAFPDIENDAYLKDLPIKARLELGQLVIRLDCFLENMCHLSSALRRRKAEELIRSSYRGEFKDRVITIDLLLKSEVIHD
jgi:hypothetical protein